MHQAAASTMAYIGRALRHMTTMRQSARQATPASPASGDPTNST